MLIPLLILQVNVGTILEERVESLMVTCEMRVV